MKLHVTAAVLCVAVAACGGSSPTSAPSEGASVGIAEPSGDGSAGQASGEPSQTASNQTQAPPTLPLKITNVTRKVAQGGNASVSIKTKKGARCSIDVRYDSGSATASGLGPKRAGGDGSVTWNWMVGSKTHSGTYPIEVSCKDGQREGSKTTHFAVR